MKSAEHDPNSIYIAHTHDAKKKKAMPAVKIGKHDSHHKEGEEHEERQKVYKPGPFALFYKLNEGSLKKDDTVWYYKEFK